MILAGLCACADGGDPDPAGPSTSALRRICDGSDAITLAFQIGGGGMPSLEQELTARNGFSFLFVDGKCRFWSWGVGDPAALHAVATGTLSPVEEASLREDIRYADWPTLAGEHAGGGIADGSTRALSDGVHVIASNAAEPPAAVEEVLDNAYQWVDRLADRGAPMAGSVRILLQGSTADDRRFDTNPVSDWPLATDPATLVAPSDVSGRVLESSTLVTGADAELLRSLRQDALGRASWSSEIFVQSSTGARYTLLVSDVLPFEDESGLVDY